MKIAFSKSWISSTQTRKQRKYRYNAPKHISYKFASAKLHKTLRDKYSVKTLSVIKGDKVKILRGSHKGKESIVETVDRKESKLFLEKIKRSRRDGSEVPVAVEPSNVMIVSLNLEDKKRIKKLQTKIKETKKEKLANPGKKSNEVKSKKTEIKEK
jgi:large subunit ribosomal protein L24